MSPGLVVILHRLFGPGIAGMTCCADTEATAQRGHVVRPEFWQWILLSPATSSCRELLLGLGQLELGISSKWPWQEEASRLVRCRGLGLRAVRSASRAVGCQFIGTLAKQLLPECFTPQAIF